MAPPLPHCRNCDQDGAVCQSEQHERDGKTVYRYFIECAWCRVRTKGDSHMAQARTAWAKGRFYSPAEIEKHRQGIRPIARRV